MRGGILSAGLLAGVCVVSVLAAPGVLADEPAGAAGITVEYHFPHLTVRVSHPTHLLAVLGELCQRTNANCDLGPELAQVPLEPMIVQGTWFEVVRKLFEGTPFDLGAIAPSPRQAGRLLVKRTMPAKALERQGADRAGNGANQANGETQSEVRGDGSSLSSPTGDAPHGTNQQPQTQQSTTAGGTVGLSQAQSGLDAPKDGAGQLGSTGATISSVTGQATQPPAAGALSEDQARTSLEAIHDLYIGPPPGSLTLPPPGMAVLPFPDENGNPILLRITNQPITMLPFPDSQGRPIPVAPGVPGLKVQYPFPLTPPEPK